MIIRIIKDKITFVMHDVFNDEAIVREAKKIIGKRWPEVLTKETHVPLKNKIEWKY